MRRGRTAAAGSGARFRGSAVVFRFFVERVGAGFAAEAAYAVERLFAIPARALGRQALTGWHRRRAHGRRDDRLDRHALVRNTFLYRFQDSPLPAARQ